MRLTVDPLHRSTMWIAKAIDQGRRPDPLAYFNFNAC
jgi:hypothetical protein